MLETGIRGRQSVAVTPENPAKTMGSGTLNVFATPALVALAEKTCWMSVADALDEGCGSVGTKLELEHTAPTPVGMTVTCESELTAVEGRKLVFKVSLYDEKGPVGGGVHERFVVNDAKFAAKAGPLLLIVDPLQSFLPAGVEMASRNQMRSILLPLKAIAAAQQCAVLLVMHSNKKQGVSDRKRLADSSDIWDMARSVLMMGRSNSDGKIYLSHEKSSYSRPQQTVLLHIEDVELDGVRTAQAVFDGYTDKKDADFIKEPRVRQAQTKEDTRDAILNVLAESRLGSMASPQLKSEVMREIGCSERTYKSAYAELVKAGDIGKRPIRQRDGTNKWYSFLYQGETGCTLPK